MIFTCAPTCIHGGSANSAPHLVPAEQAALRLHRHPITVRRDLREGRLPGQKIGGRWYMSSETLAALTEGRPS